MTKTHFQVLVAHVARHSTASPQDAESIARRLRRLGIKGLRLAVAACNRPLTPAEEREAERVDERFEALCREIGCKAKISDPRGYGYHVVFPGDDAPWNTWGGRTQGWGVTG